MRARHVRFGAHNITDTFYLADDSVVVYLDVPGEAVQDPADRGAVEEEHGCGEQIVQQAGVVDLARPQSREQHRTPPQTSA